MDRPVVAVILAGGTGSRLYPASRSDRPKQFLALGDSDDDRSLLARTAARTGFADATLVATRPEFADEVPDHAPDAEVVVEPAGKDTGPAIVYATHRARDAVDGDPVVVVLPADHHVPDGDAFEATMERGARVAAETDRLVAFGVEPTRPATGYGYVEPGEEHSSDGSAVDYRDLAAFHEKPDGETAAEYVDAGYYWNAGIFAWTPAALFDQARDTPLGPLVGELDSPDPNPVAGFDAVDPVSIDYAVMERADRAAVVPADFAWDDLGAWDALERVLDADDRADADGNVVAGDAEALAVDAADNVVAGDEKHVSLVGVEGLCVVAYDDRVLVVPTGEAQRVRDAVDRLKATGRF
ncbi:NTP transferase domain-containing protein [Halobaculum sp. CBA1158]|uniref:mannose-1-phosphate guanylyltransferase n=1 Tax=Halobaculum sp. CBA1158 TaxID=2904243 RepID=UPI001F3B3DE3|nr:sugar phosphate nucleotidyltransferase [Halobaculum sp. CBA1158]UIP00176.1 NTP transferase domain-containing protein [Halobaculum sp. CBA1158]